jgi:hypothetical protein
MFQQFCRKLFFWLLIVPMNDCFLRNAFLCLRQFKKSVLLLLLRCGVCGQTAASLFKIAGGGAATPPFAFFT